MANPAGIQNGTKVILRINTGSGFVDLCGEATHSTAFNRDSIETTNKCSDQYRTVLTGDEGTKSLDITVDSLYSDDPAYQFLRSSYYTGEEVPVERVLGGLTLTAGVMVASMSDTADLNSTVSTSFTLNSTGSFSEA